jgi:hypothetical protein
MDAYEKLGVFYLGKGYDLKEKKVKDDLLLYDSKDLVTHAVCVGMTGSGKTGLCIALIEEAALDGVPAILIDPKGDLSNLLLTFPALKPTDFEPWVNQDDARQKGLSTAEFAVKQAETWTKGLADWQENGARIQKLRDSVEFKIFTPGSNAGFPVSILKSFAAPPQAIIEDGELMRERVSTTVTSLLSLVGIDADPLKSREHILLSNIIESIWRKGQDLDLADLIQQVQRPALKKIGVLELDSFYPEKDRFELMMSLNNLLASPGFAAWLEGEALDIDKILYTPKGKPRVAIFSIAHLGDAERMFFTSLLLNQILGWMRAQSGTTSLRSILYMDEIFGYLPPLGNPPSKLPLLTLLKQARAFGLGLVLSTQNPVDLDYKALSNTGTWFVGRLQTERDKARLLDGLEGASASLGGKFNRSKMEATIAGLGNRVFLMNNTHDDESVVFTTRWVMSYLRGPLTREQIKVLMDPMKTADKQSGQAAKTSTGATMTVPSTASKVVDETSAQAVLVPGQKTTTSSTSVRMITVPADVPTFYLPVKKSPSGGQLIYRPSLVGVVRTHYVDSKLKIDSFQTGAFTTPMTDKPVPVDWADAKELPIPVDSLTKSSEEGASYADLPSAAGRSTSFTDWEKEFTTWLVSAQDIDLFRSPSMNIISNSGETEAQFRVRLSQKAREARDEQTEKLRAKYAPKIQALQEKVRKATQALEKEKDQVKAADLQSAISIGATLLGALSGRRTSSRVATAARGVGRSISQRADISSATENEAALREQLTALQKEFDDEVASLTTKIDPATETFETVSIHPKKTDIAVQLLAVLWQPYLQTPQGAEVSAW